MSFGILGSGFEFLDNRVFGRSGSLISSNVAFDEKIFGIDSFLSLGSAIFGSEIVDRDGFGICFIRDNETIICGNYERKIGNGE